MMTQEELAIGLQQIYDQESDIDVDPQEARQRIAEAQAQLIAQFVIGRTTVVTGTVAGTAVTGTGIIQ
ncbi:hypothetical protein EZY14_009345 [Kordia sp. TARA_039_SRF]|nr:hypothetical protein EZY14_009345 [Kordia sp. TARA_039_SRF]